MKETKTIEELRKAVDSANADVKAAYTALADAIRANASKEPVIGTTKEIL